MASDAQTKMGGRFTLQDRCGHYPAHRSPKFSRAGRKGLRLDGMGIGPVVLVWNCGNNVPQVVGNPLAIVSQQFDMRPNLTTGVISGTVYGSNQILCGNVFSTQWLVTEYKSGTDVRDRMYRKNRAAPRTVPPVVDLRAWAGPVKDQLNEGSCTGHAFSSAREWIARRHEKSSVILSPQSLYAEELVAEGTFPQDNGARVYGRAWN
jgi:hypothetical protein